MELVRLGAREDRLFDLASDGSMTTKKIRERLSSIRVERARLTEQLSATEEVVGRESEILLNYLLLLEQPGSLYVVADDNVKRRFLAAYFTCIWIEDEDHQLRAEVRPQEPVARIRKATGGRHSQIKGTELLGAFDFPESTLFCQSECSSKNGLVHTGDGHSSKSSLSAPTPEALARLVEFTRRMRAPNPPVIEQTTPPRSIKRRLTKQQRDDILRRRQAGETLHALAHEFGISESGLRDLLFAATMEMKKPPMTAEDVVRAVALYESGLSARQIALELCYPLGTIRRVLKAQGLKMRVSGQS